MNDSKLAACGVNISTVHLDFMFGSENTVVHAVLQDNATVTLMEDGRFIA